jgi:hypothetical protein
MVESSNPCILADHMGTIMRGTAPVFLILALAAGGCTKDITYFRPSAPSGRIGGIGTCDTVNRGIQFTAEPDGDFRVVYIATFVSADSPPNLIVMIGRQARPSGGGYWTQSQKRAIEELQARGEAWLNDRSRPYIFSSNEIELSWKGGERSFPIPDLIRVGDHFVGTEGKRGEWPFYLKPALEGFSGNSFDLVLPSITYDNMTVKTAPVHFVRTNETVLQPLNC